jgi:hypothetical protein
LGQGIYAEVTLHFKHAAWRPSEWTFPDYRREDYHLFFTEARRLLRGQISGGTWMSNSPLTPGPSPAKGRGEGAPLCGGENLGSELAPPESAADPRAESASLTPHPSPLKLQASSLKPRKDAT